MSQQILHPVDRSMTCPATACPLSPARYPPA